MVFPDKTSDKKYEDKLSCLGVVIVHFGAVVVDIISHSLSYTYTYTGGHMYIKV